MLFRSKEFNSLGKLEIPYSSLVEFVVNALVHRSLNWNAPIRIFIFDNRVEIHSPGILPNGLQVEDITNGIESFAEMVGLPVYGVFIHLVLFLSSYLYYNTSVIFESLLTAPRSQVFNPLKI